MSNDAGKRLESCFHRFGLRQPPWFVALLGLYCLIGCYPNEQDALVDEPGEEVEVTPSPIYNGTTVPSATIPKTGVVQLGGCSGTLVTPYWVLTAAHCSVSVGTTVMLGNDASAPNTVTTSWVPHASWNGLAACDGAYDVALVKLQSPLFPKLDDLRPWEGYRRDLYRGAMAGIVGQHVDLYGFGNNDDGDTTGAGVLRFTPNVVEDLETWMLQYDKDPTGEARGGDSGAGVLFPSYGSPGWHADYTIAAVHSGRCEGPFFEQSAFGTRADEIAGWFDSTLGPAWTQFDYPSRIRAAAFVRR